MNSAFRILPAICTLLSLSLPLRAAEPTPDARLAQKITYSVYASLQEITAALSSKTGVTLRAGANDRDWRVRERRVRVEIRNLPLGDALSGITKTLEYDLRRSGPDGQWTYRIWQTAKSRAQEEAMRTAETERLERRMAAIRDQVFQDADEIKPLSPDEAAKLRQTDPWKAYLGGTEEGRAYLDLVRSLPNETRDGVRLGRKVDLKVADLSPAQQDAVRKMISGGIAMKGGIGPSNLKDLLPKVTPTHLIFMPLTEELKKETDNAAMAGIAVVMGDSDGSDPQLDRMADEDEKMGLGHMIPMALVPLSDSKGFGKVFADMALRLNDGEDARQVQRDFNNRLRAGEGSWEADSTGDASAPAPAPGSTSTTTPAPPPVVPALQVEVDPLDADSLDDLLRGLSEKTRLSYVMESYPDEPRITGVLPRTKGTVKALLDSLKHVGYEWEYGSGVVRLKPTNWAVERSYDVPARLILGYRQILEAKGWFDLDLLGSLCSTLTSEQIKHRIVTDKVLAEGVTDALEGDNDRVLRFYGNLSARQKTALKSPDGLDLASLTEAQGSALAPLLTEAASKDRIAGKAFVTFEPNPAIHSTASPSEPRSLEVTFRVEMTDETHPASSHWSRKLTLPIRKELVYRKPERPVKK